MEIKIKVSERLRQLRTEARYTNASVASYLGIKVSAYQHYEAGRCCAPVHILLKLASFYSLTLDQLIGIDVPAQSEIETIYNKAPLEKRRIVDFILGINAK